MCSNATEVPKWGAPSSVDHSQRRTMTSINYQLLAVMLLKHPNSEIPVAVDHSQLWTMASGEGGSN